MATPPPTPPRTPPAPPNSPNRFGWMWIVIIAALAILLIVWMFDPSGDADDIENIANVPADGYVAAPTDPAVPVELPRAEPMVGEPAISPTPIPAASPTVTPAPEQ